MGAVRFNFTDSLGCCDFCCGSYTWILKGKSREIDEGETIILTLAQERAFKSGSPFKGKLAYDIPTRNPVRAKEAVGRLRRDYEKMSPEEQRQVKELLQETWRVLLQVTKNKREFTTQERQNVWEIALMYTALKNELTRGRKR
jgi:hypothetical protein